MPWIHISSGEKGGVGKSIVSSALPEVLRAKGKEFIICEADCSNGDVGASFEGKHKVTGFPILYKGIYSRAAYH